MHDRGELLRMAEELIKMHRAHDIGSAAESTPHPSDCKPEECRHSQRRPVATYLQPGEWDDPPDPPVAST